MKPWEEKSHKLLSKTRNQKSRLKAPQRVAEKKFSGPTYDTSISHLDPMIFNCHHIRKISEWSEMETIELYKIYLIGRWEMYFIGSKCIMNTGDLNKITGSIVDQSIIRCNYSDKFSYWNWNDNARKENWNQDVYIRNDTIP